MSLTLFSMSGRMAGPARMELFEGYLGERAHRHKTVLGTLDPGDKPQGDQNLV
jgi:hypothetical protein